MSGLRDRLRSARRDGGLALLLLAWTLLALTLAHPTVAMKREVYRYMVVLDITQSMNVADYRVDGRPVTRLALAKEALRRALRRMPCGSRLGLGIFTAYRSFPLFQPVEVCAHYGEIGAALGHLDWRMAWAGDSEIAKGLQSGLRLAAKVEPRPALVFITDGQEAPPINPRHRPRFEGSPGAVKGIVVGAGGPLPVPIPKYDMEGNSLGYWKADEVLQIDPYSLGRQTSVAGETMVEADGSPVTAAKGTGMEHLSSLRETYLRQLARETGLSYHHLENADSLGDALLAAEFGHALAVEADMRRALAAIAAIALLLVPVARRHWGRRPGGRRAI